MMHCWLYFHPVRHPWCSRNFSFANYWNKAFLDMGLKVSWSKTCCIVRTSWKPTAAPHKSVMWIYHCHQDNRVEILKIKVHFACLKSSRWAFHDNRTAIYISSLNSSSVWGMSHSINDPPGLDRLPDRLSRQWRLRVQTFLKWYRDNFLCLDCTDKLQASVLALLVLKLHFAE